MNRKMSDSNIIEKCLEKAAEENSSIETSFSEEFSKSAMDISINPANVVGAIVGTVTGRKLGQRKGKKEVMKRNPEPTIGDNYYSEVDNIARNLGVTFTPVGVVYTVPHRNQRITIDTITSEEMNDEMYNAWRQRNEDYFKQLMLNKMMGEIQLTEQMHAKRLINQQRNINSAITKKANEEKDVCFEDIIEYANFLKESKENNSKLIPIIEKVASSGPEYNLSWEMERPIWKYASVISGIKGFLGFNTTRDQLKSMNKKLSDPNYLDRNLKISFMPDRVMFIVDNIVITQLHAIDMNEEGFEEFERNNQSYFRDLFSDYIKKPRLLKKNNSGDSITQKRASESKKNKLSIMSDSSIHPEIYIEYMNKNIDNWDTKDPEVLIAEICDIENISEDEVNDLAVNKVLTLNTMNQNEIYAEDPLFFEKGVRAINGKTVNFSDWQPNISLGEIVFFIKFFDEVSGEGTFLSAMTSEVSEYIAKVLAAQDIVFIHGSFIGDDRIADHISDRAIRYLSSDSLDDDESLKNILKKCKKKCKEIFSESKEKSIKKAEKIDGSERLRNICKKNLAANAGVSLMLEGMENSKESQRKALNL